MPLKASARLREGNSPDTPEQPNMAIAVFVVTTIAAAVALSSFVQSLLVATELRHDTYDE